jgi:peroxiredoxin
MLTRVTLLTMFLVAAPLTIRPAGAAESAPPKVGAPAPDFALPYATRDSIATGKLELLPEAKKGPIVVAFYPADWSGGCTKEVCTFRDGFADLAKLGVRVWGISGDYVFSHHEWAKYHKLPFELLSDHDHAVAKLYGVYNPETGHDFRTVFVVGRDGKLAYEDTKYDVSNDSDFVALKGALRDLK